MDEELKNQIKECLEDNKNLHTEIYNLEIEIEYLKSEIRNLKYLID